MRKKNVLLVTGNFPPGIGGMQSYYHNLCLESKHQITVLAPHYPDDEAFDAKQPYDIIRGRFFQNESIQPSGWGRMFRMAKKTIEERSIDITIYGYVLIGFVGWLLSVFGGHKYMVSTHGKDMLEFKKIPVLRTLTKMILKRADGVLTNSEYTRNLVEEYGVPRSKIHIVNPGVEEHFEIREKDPVLVERFGLKDKFVMMTLSRLVRRKGHDMVIQAMPEILKQIPEAVYLIVGDGPEKERLQQLAQSCGVQNAVIFAGRASDGEEIHKFYNTCDLFIMASRHLKVKGDVEGFGIVFLEASCCGKPVVAGNSGGIAEAVLHNETGLLIDPNSVEDISSSVIKLYKDDELRERLVDRAYKRAKSEFKYSYLASIMDSCISMICDKVRPTGRSAKVKESKHLRV
ncbi:glycosyltransferase family 4 protein [Marinicrinis lubricantis]|uniref:Glycosyltransferase family 4 protein n=1 Tax=Marinicrinis lubricantis TaxID=2086470 RepID=A0ABW1IK56_9BACL